MTPTTPTVTTDCGRLAGEWDRGVSVFRGVPFAAPPVGPLRFRPPQPPVPWDGVRPATTFGPAPAQVSGPLSSLPGFAVDDTDEDCLTLNVWTPAADGGSRPVMVWVPGGGFAQGSGSQAIYDGAALAGRGDVVVVTMNYRLGALGFLYLDPGVGIDGYRANLGLLDQVAALRWVQANIAGFGGDPDNVTVFGESAGAMSVTCLLGLPEAHGLFRRAVAQSGASLDMLTPDRAQAVTDHFLGHLGLRPGDAVKLLDLPLDALLSAQQECATSFRRLAEGLPFRPVTDGDVLPRPPVEALAGGAARHVPLLIGTNLDEWRLFGLADPRAATLDEARLRDRLERLMEGAGPIAVAYRRALPDASPTELWYAFQSDRLFMVPATRFAEAQAQHQPDTYVYLWTRPSPIEVLGACHGLEIPFVFGNLEAPGMAVFAGTGAEVAELSRRAQDAWLAFARTGQPGWPPYELERRTTMVFDSPTRMEDDPLRARRQAWDGVL